MSRILLLLLAAVACVHAKENYREEDLFDIMDACFDARQGYKVLAAEEKWWDPVYCKEAKDKYDTVIRRIQTAAVATEASATDAEEMESATHADLYDMSDNSEAIMETTTSGSTPTEASQPSTQPQTPTAQRSNTEPLLLQQSMRDEKKHRRHHHGHRRPHKLHQMLHGEHESGSESDSDSDRDESAPHQSRFNTQGPKDTTNGKRFLWPKATVPFTFVDIDTNIKASGQVTKDGKSSVVSFTYPVTAVSDVIKVRATEAMLSLEKLTCLDFVELPQAADEPDLTVDEPLERMVWAHRTSGCGSLAPVGRKINAAHLLVLQDTCKAGSVKHELLHGLGFMHDHQRDDILDRFSVVTSSSSTATRAKMDNILNSAYLATYSNNPGQIEDSLEDMAWPTGFTEYDQQFADAESVLTYSTRGCALQPKQLPAKDDDDSFDPVKFQSDNKVLMGQRDKYADIDIYRVNKLYCRPAVVQVGDDGATFHFWINTEQTVSQLKKRIGRIVGDELNGMMLIVGLGNEGVALEGNEELSTYASTIWDKPIHYYKRAGPMALELRFESGTPTMWGVSEAWSWNELAYLISVVHPELGAKAAPDTIQFTYKVPKKYSESGEDDVVITGEARKAAIGSTVENGDFVTVTVQSTTTVQTDF